MSIKKFSTFSIITTSLLGGCDLFESQSQKELEKTVEQNKQNHSNTYKPVIKKELTSDNNPITVPSVPHLSEDSSNQNKSITTENSNKPEDIIENKNEADRQLDEARYGVLNNSTEANNTFDFIISSDQDTQDVANFLRRDNYLEKNDLVLKEIQKNQDIEWKNKYDEFLNEHKQKKNKYKNITPEQKAYILQKDEEIWEKL